MQFSFPSEPIDSVTDLDEAKRIISSCLEFENLSYYCKYKFQRVGANYIYCRCRDCPARLVFRRKGERFDLVKAKLNH